MKVSVGAKNGRCDDKIRMQRFEERPFALTSELREMRTPWEKCRERLDIRCREEWPHSSGRDA
jgi:hypothetical protein